MDFKTPEELLGLAKKFPFNGGFAAIVAVLFVVIITASTMFYKIDHNEMGVVIRFGKYVRTTDPGLHIKLPLGIESVEPVKVKKIFKEEFGFRTQQAGVRTQYSKGNYYDESLMLTGDLNALEVTWIVQFKVKDPVNLLFSLRNPVGTLRVVSESVMRSLVGDHSVDEVLTTERASISSAAEVELQKILDSYNSGIDIVTVKLQDVAPPQKVQSAFNAVNEAKQEKERMINQALQKYNKIIPQAKGEAEKTILKAEAYSINRVNRAKGDSVRFSDLLSEYEQAPKVMKSRLYLESLEEIYSQPKEKFIMDGSHSGMLPLMDFRTKGDK